MNLNKNNKRILSKKKGFTIIESLVAIFILVISLTGPMVFSQSGLRASFVSRDQITAFFLAQDAIEYIKNIRDDNLINIIDTGSGDWLDNIENYCFSDGCAIDTTINNSPFDSCSIFNNVPGCMSDPTDSATQYNPMLISDNGVIGFSGSENSIFSRHIMMEQISDDEIEITVYVRWSTAQTIGTRQIEVKENIFNWLAN